MFLYVKRKFSCFSRELWKFIVVSGIILYVICMLLSSYPCCQSSRLLNAIGQYKRSSGNNSPASIDDLVFGIAGSSNTWGTKRWYIEAWWRPNVTRGFLFLDRPPTEHLPWPSTSPPYRISEDTSRYKEYNKHPMPFAIRMVRVIEETFKAVNDSVKWYVLADDDTVLFIDNLLEVLSRYDYRKYFYIGMNSESVVSNNINSFGMAFGGAGYALSYPLAKAVANNMDLCIKRYQTLFGSDHILQSCIADLGVSLTQEKGFHQIDLRRDISGFLSAHPQSPLLSLHHLDVVEPIFPSMNRFEAVNHLMKAAKVDQSRLFQQSICYQKENNWTFSVSWGYSVQIYRNLFPPSVLHRPLETFLPWLKGARPPYMFNVRPFSRDPCEAPHTLFFTSVDETKRNNHTVTTYNVTSHQRPPGCVSNGSRLVDDILKIRVLSPLEKHYESRRECCDIVQPVGMDSMAIKLRECMKDEIVA